MCLGTKLKDQKRAIRRITDRHGFIRVWKLVFDDGDHFVGECYQRDGYEPGINIAEESCNDWGFHAFRNEKSAKIWASAYSEPLGFTIIQCLALPEWVVECGHLNRLATIKFTKLCFPEYPKKKVTIKEFRKALSS